MAGVTAQQIMRKKYKILVRHVASGSNYLTEVSYDGKIVAELPDDCLASGSLYQTQKIWASLPKVLYDYPMQACYAYLPGKNIVGAVTAWNREQFERDLLPTLRRRLELEKQLSVYDAVVDCRDESDTYALYDILVRIYLYVRTHNIKLQREGIDGLTVVRPMDALRRLGHEECVELGDGVEKALLAIYSDFERIDHGGKQYLVSGKPISALQSACGGEHVEMTDDAIQQLITAGKDMAAVRVSVERGGVDMDSRQGYAALVANILRQGGLGFTPEEKDLVQYRDQVVAEGKVGKNATVGLGKVFGEGPLAERLDAGFQLVCQKARHLSGAECYKLAASRLAGMNSAKTTGVEGGILMLRDRTVSVVGVGGSRLGATH